MKRRISHGQATRSTFMFWRVIHFIGAPNLSTAARDQSRVRTLPSEQRAFRPLLAPACKPDESWNPRQGYEPRAERESLPPFGSGLDHPDGKRKWRRCNTRHKSDQDRIKLDHI